MAQNKPQQINTTLIEVLLVIVTVVTSVTLVILLAFVVSKILLKGSKKAKTDLMPMYQFQNSNGTDTIQTLSTSVPETRPSRVPTEDRVPASNNLMVQGSNQSGYDNPILMPSPQRRKNLLPPL